MVTKENMASETTRDVIIVGAGPAGCTAAIYASRYKLDTLMIADEIGGLMLYADMVENFPGFGSIKGKDLMQQMADQALELQVDLVQARVDSIAGTGNFFTVKAGNAIFHARAVILATGTIRRKLGIPGEEENIGMGVSYCATCDAPFFKKRTCCVIGGSDSAAKEALVLSRIAKKVHVIYRKSRLRAEPLLSDRVYNTANIEVIHDSNVKEICTNEQGLVNKVLLDDGSELETNGVFIEIGFDPNTSIAKDLDVELNEHGEIIVDKNMCTNVPGVFAAGDVTNGILKQAITAAGDGAKASWSAYQHVLSW